MSLTPSIAVAQSALAPNLVIVTDDSTGSDVAISVRRIFVQDSQGNYLVPAGTTTDYTIWPLVNTSISLDILTQDIGASITVQWLNSSNVVLYTFNQLYPLAQFNQQFLVYLIQLQGLTPGVYQDINYSGNLGIFYTNIIGGITAIQTGADIAGAQNCFSRATYMRLNQTKYF